MAEAAAAAPLPMQAPSRLLLLAEARAVLEVGLGLATAPLMRLAPRGDGHAVLVLPGFMASDRSTSHLRDVLQRLGYAAHGWEMGRNLGVVANLRQALRARLALLQGESGRRVSLALAMPDKVRRVITLGSPFSGDLGASNVRNLYDAVAGDRVRVRPDAALLARLAGDLGVPATAIYSRTDGIVNWRTSVLTPNEHAENIEILGASHLALGFNPAAVWAVADRLAQGEGQFTKFRRSGPFAGAYGALA